MNEAETRAELIDPVLRELGWVTEDSVKVSREFKINNGRILTGGRNADPKIADYLLTVNDQDLAVIEAKSDEKPLSEGVAQAKNMLNCSKLDLHIPQMVKKSYRLIWRQEKKRKSTTTQHQRDYGIWCMAISQTGRQSLMKYHLKPIVAQNRCVITRKTQSIMY